MVVLETARLALRHLGPADAPFILDLLNQPSWLRFIGDRGVRTLDDARAYIANGPAAMIARHGFGLFLVQRRADGEPLGMCGLIKRDALADVDLGFAFLPQHWGQGYAVEAAAGTLAYARVPLGLKRVLAITDPQNEASMRVLAKLGFTREGRVVIAGLESVLFGLAL
jgi:RimJ/RimL family protein N-acetyltransferase